MSVTPCLLKPPLTARRRDLSGEKTSLYAMSAMGTCSPAGEAPQPLKRRLSLGSRPRRFRTAEEFTSSLGLRTRKLSAAKPATIASERKSAWRSERFMEKRYSNFRRGNKKRMCEDVDFSRAKIAR